MKDAPKGALFVWCNGHLEYPKALARHLGREDLYIISPGQLENPKFRGRELSGIVLDHWTLLNERERLCYRELWNRVILIKD